MSQEEIKNIKDLHENYIIESLRVNIINSTNTADQNAVNEILKRPFFRNFEVKKLEDKIQSLYSDYVKQYTFKPRLMNIDIVGDFNKDNTLSVTSEFKVNKFYLTPINYYYLIKPNSLLLKGNWLNQNKREDKDAAIKENETSVGFEFNYNNLKKSFFMSNTTFIKENELQGLIKYSNSEKHSSWKQVNGIFRVIYTHNIKERPFVFRERLEYDNLHQVGMQYTHKIIKNYINEFKATPQLVSNTPQEDSVHQFKVFYNQHVLNTKDNYSLKLNSSINNSVNSVYIKSKLFLRRIFALGYIKNQINFEAANITNLRDKKLNTHEKYSINHFRGLSKIESITY
jgi:hypothetical protein